MRLEKEPREELDPSECFSECLERESTQGSGGHHGAVPLLGDMYLNSKNPLLQVLTLKMSVWDSG